MDISRVEGFDWDEANTQKNWGRHRVMFYECEGVFFRDPLILPDADHSREELRFFAMGQTLRDRRLTIVFTVRNNRIRVISARDMSRRERRDYEKTKKDSKI